MTHHTFRSAFRYYAKPHRRRWDHLINMDAFSLAKWTADMPVVELADALAAVSRCAKETAESTQHLVAAIKTVIDEYEREHAEPR